MAGYADPFVDATLTPERIDQGVDYAGSGAVNAIADGIITQANQNDPGWEGGAYLEYQVTQAGPLQGQRIYVAEGASIAQGLKVGDKVSAGDQIATIIKGSSTGIETGFGSGIGTETYARAHGGFTDGVPTAAGEAFSTLINDLGGPPGRATSTRAIGSAPPAVAAAIKQGTAPFDGSSSIGAREIQRIGGNQNDPVINTAQSAVNTAGSVVSAGEAFANFLSNPVPVLLTVALVLVGGGLIYTGVRHMLGTDNPQPQGQRFRIISLGGKTKAAEEAVLV